MINILITGVGGDIGSNVARILREQKLYDVRIIGCDINEYVYPLKYLDSFEIVHKVKQKEYQDDIMKIVKKYNIDCIFPIPEVEIEWYMKNNFFSDINIIINRNDLIDTFLDKFKTSIFLKKLGCPTPKTVTLKNYNYFFDYPIVIKPRKSSGSKQIFLAHNKKQLDNIRDRININSFVVQEYIGSEKEEYTSCVFRNNDFVRSISFKRDLKAGMTSFAELINDSHLESMLLMLSNKINLNGSINIQSRKYANEYYIFEVNPRISSTVYIRNQFGFNDVLWWIANINNLEMHAGKQTKFGKAVLGYDYSFYY